MPAAETAPSLTHLGLMTRIPPCYPVSEQARQAPAVLLLHTLPVEMRSVAAIGQIPKQRAPGSSERAGVVDAVEGRKGVGPGGKLGKVCV